MERKLLRKFMNIYLEDQIQHSTSKCDISCYTIIKNKKNKNAPFANNNIF